MSRAVYGGIVHSIQYSRVELKPNTKQVFVATYVYRSRNVSNQCY